MATTETLVHLTPAARRRLRELHDGATDPIVRLFVAGRTCCGHRFGLSFEKSARDDDSITPADGVTLVGDPESRTPCVGATLDYLEIEGDAGFMVRPAGPAPACACAGSSA